MKFHPLTIPHLVELDPEKYPDLEKLRNAWMAKLPGFFGKFGLETGKLPLQEGEEDLIGFSSIDGIEFRNSSICTDKDLIKSPNLQKFLVGKTLDLFLDIPLAHMCEITHYEYKGSGSAKVFFDTNLAPMEASAIPRHTPESYQATISRKGIEVLGELTVDWIAVRIIRALGPEGLAGLNYEGLIEKNEDVSSHESAASQLRLISFGMNTKDGTILMASPRCFASGKHLRVYQAIPESILSGITGKKFDVLLETPLICEVRIQNYYGSGDQHGFIMEVPAEEESFAGSGKIKDILPDIHREALEIARKAEEEALPGPLRDYREWLHSIDAKRDAPQETNVLTSHLYRSFNGAWRRFENSNGG